MARAGQQPSRRGSPALATTDTASPPPPQHAIASRVPGPQAELRWPELRGCETRAPRIGARATYRFGSRGGLVRPTNDTLLLGRGAYRWVESGAFGWLAPAWPPPTFTRRDRTVAGSWSFTSRPAQFTGEQRTLFVRAIRGVRKQPYVVVCPACVHGRESWWAVRWSSPRP
jgi:hypothetical protein